MLFCFYYAVLLLCCSVIICVVLCTDLCTVPLPPGVNPIAIDKYININVPLCSGSVYGQADTQQMLSSCPSSSLRDDHVMESNRAAFCLWPQTGLVAGPRSVRKAVLAGSKEHQKRSLAGRLAGWQAGGEKA